ncbi:MAG: hypothetical protein GF317_10990 [Candidatus Lokiarchaeota archaeon]|nr:hypothetical protein [Candidatus Lokiarchaeota archaeon]MBD3200188.1 hypothetical protein [Candidatus Lokiarchaeota archaeon]
MKVSFSKIKITPKNLDGVRMAGYARPDTCKGTLDDIFAHATLILSSSENNNDKEKLLLISIDILKFPISVADYVKKKISEAFNDISYQNILIHATHTHSAPDITGEFHWPGTSFLDVMKGIMFGINRNDEYVIWLSKKIIKLVEKLNEGLKNCKIAWKKKQFNPNLVINRRHPSEIPKTDLGVISFRDLDNKLIGIIINYQCHPTTLSFFNNKLSADFPGRIIARISEMTQGQVKALYFNGAAGDLNPITTCGTNYESLEIDKTPIYDQLGTYKHTRRLGYRIAEVVMKLTESIPNKEYYQELSFQSYIKVIFVPLKDPRYFSLAWLENKLYYLIKKYILLSVVKVLYKKTNFPIFRLIKKGRTVGAQTILQFIKFITKKEENRSEFSIFTVPGELFEKIGEKLIYQSPTGKDNSFIFQNSNDWIAYLFPLGEYIEIGGYEPVASFSPLSGYYVHKMMLELFAEIKR